MKKTLKSHTRYKIFNKPATNVAIRQFEKNVDRDDHEVTRKAEPSVPNITIMYVCIALTGSFAVSHHWPIPRCAVVSHVYTGTCSYNSSSTTITINTTSNTTIYEEVLVTLSTIKYNILN